MTVLKLSRSALDVVVTCLVAENQTRLGRAFNTWRLWKALGEPPALTFHYIFHYISHPCSWWQSHRDCSGVAMLCTEHTSSRLSHTPCDTHLYVRVCTITLNALLSALVNPRLLLVVYKSKGHRASGGLWQSWHPILICFYLVSRMYPGQIWGNIAKCKSSAYNTPRITLQIKFWLQCVVCLFAKAVMLSTQMDPDRAMSPGSPQRVHIIGNIPAPGLEKHRAELIPHLLHVQ